MKWSLDADGIPAEEALDYETVREYMVVISRMTGYEDEDIREYLENSFAELIWDWGYFALIIKVLVNCVVWGLWGLAGGTDLRGLF